MNLPWASGIDPNDGSNALMAGMKLAQEKKQNAAQNLLGQQRLQMDQQRMQAENARAEAESRRADAAGRREDRMLSAQERAQKVQGATAILPYLDPNSDKFNPQMAQSLGPAYGVGIAQQPDSTQAPAPPQEPQAPSNAPVPVSPQRMAGPTSTAADPAQSLYRTMGRPAGAYESTDPLAPPVITDDGKAPSPTQHEYDPQTQAARFQATKDMIAEEQARMQQRAEQEQYKQQLAESPAKHAKYAADLGEFQLRKQFPTYQMDLGDGNPMTVDTLAMHKQAESTRQLRTQKWAEALDGDQEAQKVALPLAHLGVPDDKIAAAVNTHREKRGALDEKAAEKAQYNLTAKQQWDLRQMEARARLMSAQTGAGSKQDAAAARAQGVLERAEGIADKRVDWKGLVGMDNTMRSLLANVSGDTALQHKDAQIQLARLMRQAQPTEGEMHLLYNNLGGTADKWNQFWASVETGDMSHEQQRQLQAATATTKHEFEARKGRSIESLKTAFGPGSGFEELGPQVNSMLKSKGQAIGVDIPDVYDASTSGPGAVLLGSRKPRGAKPQKSNPLVDGAQKNVRNQKIQAMPPEDKAAVDWADKHPQDPRAANILKLHGL